MRQVGSSGQTNWSSSAGSLDPVRHSERFWTDCGDEKSDTDSAAGSEGLGVGSVIVSESSECGEIYCLNSVPSENVHFHCARHSDFDSVCHYVEG